MQSNRQYNTIQYNTIQYNMITNLGGNLKSGVFLEVTIDAIQYNTIQYNTMQYNTIQYNTICCQKMTYIYTYNRIE